VGSLGGDVSVTIIIPTFNRSHFLKECLDAIFRQTQTPSEIIVVDDGSIDDTGAVLEEYSRAVRVIRHENKGKAASLNVAIEAASNAWVWVIDDDDIVSDDALERLQHTIKMNPNADFVYGKHLRFRTTRTGKRDVSTTGYWTECENVDFHLSTMEDFFAHQAGMLISKSALLELDGLNEDLGRSQDYELLVRLATRYEGALCEGVIFHQRVHDGERGLANDRFDVAMSEIRWIEADKLIFQQLREQLPLSLYLPKKNTSPFTRKMERRALLQRATIMARKKLWDKAIIDLNMASEANAGEPLGKVEKKILYRLTGSKYGCDELLTNSAIAQQLAEIGSASTLGSSIVYHVARGLNWRIKQAVFQGRFKSSAQFLILQLSLFKSAIIGSFKPEQASSTLDHPLRIDKY